jgi:hypothetical protein
VVCARKPPFSRSDSERPGARRSLCPRLSNLSPMCVSVAPHLRAKARLAAPPRHLDAGARSMLAHGLPSAHPRVSESTTPPLRRRRCTGRQTHQPPLASNPSAALFDEGPFATVFGDGRERPCYLARDSRRALPRNGCTSQPGVARRPSRRAHPGVVCSEDGLRSGRGEFQAGTGVEGGTGSW